MTSSTALRTAADALDILSNPAPMPAPIDPALSQLVDDILLLEKHGMLAETILPSLAKVRVRKASKPATIALKPARTARKARQRKPAMREVNGRMMPADAATITDGQVSRITTYFKPAAIKRTAKALAKQGIIAATDSLKGMSCADAAILYATLKGQA